MVWLGYTDCRFKFPYFRPQRQQYIAVHSKLRCTNNPLRIYSHTFGVSSRYAVIGKVTLVQKNLLTGYSNYPSIPFFFCAISP